MSCTHHGVAGMLGSHHLQPGLVIVAAVFGGLDHTKNEYVLSCMEYSVSVSCFCETSLTSTIQGFPALATTARSKDTLR